MLSEEEPMHVTCPHGVQKLLLVDDSTKSANRIYLIRDTDKEDRPDEEYRGISILGSELEDLTKFWSKEKERQGSPGSTGE